MKRESRRMSGYRVHVEGVTFTPKPSCVMVRSLQHPVFLSREEMKKFWEEGAPAEKMWSECLFEGDRIRLSAESSIGYENVIIMKGLDAAGEASAGCYFEATLCNDIRWIPLLVRIPGWVLSKPLSDATPIVRRWMSQMESDGFVLDMEQEWMSAIDPVRSNWESLVR